jgi:hypothetical protein
MQKMGGTVAHFLHLSSDASVLPSPTAREEGFGDDLGGLTNDYVFPTQ